MAVKHYWLYLVFIAVLGWSPCYGDWESDANARIEQIRKRNAEITVVDSLGAPVPGINVQIEQIGHRFAFGTCITNTKMTDASYKDFILDHFEWAVCENETKWPDNEPSRDSETYTYADNIYQWANSNGLNFRGHCLFWEQPSKVQDWVQLLGYATYPTPSDLLGEVDERIDSAVNKYKNKFRHWDVDNEMLTDSFYDRLGEGGRVHMYERAKLRDPNCLMFMNEYNGNSFGGYNSTPYAARATSLIGMGAPIDALGIQGHLGANLTFDPALYYSDVLQPLAALDLPIWATEFDARHTDENISADNIENYFRICFSHPSVEGIIMWGFLEGSMWRADAYLVDASWNLTVRGERYEDLMDEWTTNDSDTTDASGKVSFRGFHGTYQITLSKTGQPTEIYTIELEPGQTPAQFVLKRYASDVGILGSWVSGTSHTKESGTNRALVFIAHARHNSTSATSLNSVTYGGRAMTKVVEKITSSASNPRIYTAAFILNDANIIAASNTTFVPTWSGTPTYTAYGSAFLQNVNQSSLTGATAGDEITTGYMLTTPMLATSAGDMVIDAATSSGTGAYTTNNAFTEALDFTFTSSRAVEGYKQANGASEIPSFTNLTSNTHQTAIGFVVKAPANEFILSNCGNVLAADYGLTSDISSDCHVNYADLKIIADHWLDTNCIEPGNCEGADFEPTDGIVDLFDFTDFAVQWMMCNDPTDPNCTPNW
ncbi:MAG: endo-1,4-beta-xylanase [Phycisphaerae bacterium]|nr:endo-1,4-beta-xylanase [Phycisphaerae bacterium]MDD5380245.1 endo-1,4-beta-xylanase [Phycisphaerae bacterium]